MVNKRGPVELARAIALIILVIIFGLLLTIINGLLWPVYKIFDPTFYCAHRITMFFTSIFTWPFFRAKLVGLENLKKVEHSAIFIANHQSLLDAFVFYDLKTNMKATFKNEIVFYPGVGTAMLLAGYLPVKRGDRGSGKKLLESCAAYLKQGVWPFFFPEGTRKSNVTAEEPLGPFKPGAYRLAIDTGVPIVPVTISGARDLFPARGLPALGFGQPLITFHPPIQTRGRDVDSLMTESRAIIASALRECDMDAPLKASSAPGSSTTVPKAE